MADFNTGSVRANGINFHYLEMGDGPLAICLHGFPTTPGPSATCCPTWRPPASAPLLPSCAATRPPKPRRTGGTTPH